ncbi:hypothetical protein SCHPADRAFT_675212 [Schizopora paradoxa]|uniref:Ig-like domain-containing protein n=1 Tax=Schizopora paradoxa TaxID=27342 RepID=A0A0H2R4X2_9AGAM|nr:hypothetical protein SCHPADRAFT_675212 [Schizopora paradoxa]
MSFFEHFGCLSAMRLVDAAVVFTGPGITRCTSPVLSALLSEPNQPLLGPWARLASFHVVTLRPSMRLRLNPEVSPSGDKRVSLRCEASGLRWSNSYFSSRVFTSSLVGHGPGVLRVP